ncbi:cytidylyltransferase domain-containing protein [Halobacillus salinus]|uniref:Acylneuraminate cytidylyltransferase family protein n=1 Tax=Halobacillus salinus TaxID=192814 RepID=A0A4Z0GZN7_9BACI|nr:acylneuraminate cytidylyltransferase family protein [Halobacillus salinus]TGB02733.1 acylneuraminate cytidylyltransferase family protein [Halobacillus salinus]
MIDGKKVLGIIPARGGSKGVPRKNIRPIAGKPLIAWTIEAAKNSVYIDRLIVSTEDLETVRVAQEWGAEVPFVRPRELAQDDTPGAAPALHALSVLSDYEYVVLLQPTSPLRTAEDIDGCIAACIEADAPSCLTVVEADQHPQWMYGINDSSYLTSLTPDKERVIRRQDLPKVYAVNGAVYIAEAGWLRQTKDFFKEGHTLAHIMEPDRSWDIDTPLDFSICDFLLRRKRN